MEYYVPKLARDKKSRVTIASAVPTSVETYNKTNQNNLGVPVVPHGDRDSSGNRYKKSPTKRPSLPIKQKAIFYTYCSG